MRSCPAPSHMAVLLDKDRRPMMNADLDVAKGRLMLRLNIKPPRDFTGKILEVWLVPPDGTPRSLGLFPSEKSGTTSGSRPAARDRRSAGQRGAGRQPRAVGRLEDRRAFGSGPVLGRGHSRRPLRGNKAAGSRLPECPFRDPSSWRDSLVGDRRSSAGLTPTERPNPGCARPARAQRSRRL